jgi:hypothetical protein
MRRPISRSTVSSLQVKIGRKPNKELTMTKYNKEVSEIVGLYLGDRYSQLCVVNQQGEIVEQGRSVDDGCWDAEAF